MRAAPPRFTPAASVSTAPRRNDPACVLTKASVAASGTAKITSSASARCAGPAAATAPSRSAAASAASVRSIPITRSPSSVSRFAYEPPMSPRPTTAAVFTSNPVSICLPCFPAP